MVKYCCKRIIVYCQFFISAAKSFGLLLVGMWRLTKVPQPAITIFGGSRITADSIYAKKASKIAELLALNKYSVITGGGPGIMEAANKGAYEAAKKLGIKKSKVPRSVGISLTSFSKEIRNKYVNDMILMRHFFARKWLLVRYSIGYIVFPGGFGTLDELFEVLTLEQTSKMQKLPVILIGKHYWGPLIFWAKKRALIEGLITEQDLKLLHITSSVKEAVEIIKECCKTNGDMQKPLYHAK